MNLTEKIIGTIEGDFKIEAYQRGYRWTQVEIENLLDDIHEFTGDKYCLQPIVVKPINGYYELIDGQQRLTTLFLIMKYLEIFVDIKYSIEYTTRSGSKDLLENITTINLDSYSTNIDELYIKRAYKIIQSWFDGEKNLKGEIANKLMNKVSVIWYEVDETENSTDIFTRLNIGKINLTNAELVKALFLSDSKLIEDGDTTNYIHHIDNKMQHEIALEWDQMEKELHDEKFWAFITNEPAARYPIRMELLFDIIENKTTEESNYYTFNKFYKRFRESKDKYSTWESIIGNYQLLREWYKDFDLYHQIGFLVDQGEKLNDLIQTMPPTKSEFRREILEKIRNKMVFKKSEGTAKEEEIDYSELNYEEHPEFIRTLLLLFNIETIRQKKDNHARFPFDRYKAKGKWSLEHIHAQNSENLKTKEEWSEWLESHEKSLEAIEDTNKEEISSVKTSIEELKKHIKDEHYKGSIRDEFNSLTPVIVKLLSIANENSSMHSLSNMALLTVSENAALSNSTFDVKRMKIIDMDKKGDYIPICTRNVFLKYYSYSETNLHFWSEEDRKKYINAMNEVLYRHKDETGKPIELIKREIRYGK